MASRVVCSQYFGEKGAGATESFFWENAVSVYKCEATRDLRGSFWKHDEQHSRSD